jgi:hypothetical protein
MHATPYPPGHIPPRHSQHPLAGSGQTFARNFSRCVSFIGAPEQAATKRSTFQLLSVVKERPFMPREKIVLIRASVPEKCTQVGADSLAG